MNQDEPQPESNLPAINPLKSILVKIVLALTLIICLLVVIFVLVKLKVEQSSQRNMTLQKTGISYAPQFLQLSPNFKPSEKQRLLHCPTTLSFCSNKANFDNGIFLIKLTQSMPLLAAFDGDLELLASFHPQGAQKVEFTTAILSSADLGLIAYYEFLGSESELVPGTGNIPVHQVHEGEIIATASNQLLPTNPLYSLSFQVVQVSSTGSAILRLDNVSFK